MLCSVNSMGLMGLDAYSVVVETDLSSGLPSFEIVGLPDASVKESRDRVRAALKNCGFTLPVGKVTVNLAPADLKKVGPIYDLPIALGILKSSGQLPGSLEESLFVGELSLGGQLRRVNGVLPMAVCAKQLGLTRIFVPAENALEASVVKGVDVYGVNDLLQLTEMLRGAAELQPTQWDPPVEATTAQALDFAEIKGQWVAKRALEIAAAGGHNALLIGPPGAGKSMLAKRLPSILPPMSFEQAIETTKIHSIAGLLDETQPLLQTRPFRAPHHTISAAGMTGGGTVPRPGEISLAHNGVLFLDELPEFHRDVKEALRAPMEDRTVRINRGNVSVSFPCSVMLIGAMNPCPCGYYGHPTRECRCSESKVQAYLGRVSGPLLDRLDLHVEVAPVEFDQLSDSAPAEPSCEIRKRVVAARDIQQQRYQGRGYDCNALLQDRDVDRFCRLDAAGRNFLQDSFDRLGLSARAYSRILRVARTIADLAGAPDILQEHLMEAVQYRSLDRKYF